MIKIIIILFSVSFQLAYAVNTFSIIGTANVHGETDPCG